jgi:hypothetical protein
LPLGIDVKRGETILRDYWQEYLCCDPLDGQLDGPKKRGLFHMSGLNSNHIDELTHVLQTLDVELFEAAKSRAITEAEYMARSARLKRSFQALGQFRELVASRAQSSEFKSHVDLPIMGGYSRQEQKIVTQFLSDTKKYTQAMATRAIRISVWASEGAQGTIGAITSLWRLSWLRASIRKADQDGANIRKARQMVEDFINRTAMGGATSKSKTNQQDLLVAYCEFDSAARRIMALRSGLHRETKRSESMRSWLASYAETRTKKSPEMQPPEAMDIEVLTQRVGEPLTGGSRVVNERLAIARTVEQALSAWEEEKAALAKAATLKSDEAKTISREASHGKGLGEKFMTSKSASGSSLSRKDGATTRAFQSLTSTGTSSSKTMVSPPVETGFISDMDASVDPELLDHAEDVFGLPVNMQAKLPPTAKTPARGGRKTTAKATGRSTSKSTTRPSVTHSLAPSVTSTLAPSVTSTLAPSVTPSETPNLVPNLAPRITPSLIPRIAPSLAPREIPSVKSPVMLAAKPMTKPLTNVENSFGPSRSQKGVGSGSTSAPGPVPKINVKDELVADLANIDTTMPGDGSSPGANVKKKDREWGRL